MKMWKLLVRLMALAAVCLCADVHGELSLMKRDIPQRYCGSNLVNVLQLVCRGNIYVVPDDKRSGSLLHNTVLPEEDDASLWRMEERRFPFRSRLSASSLVPRSFRRSKRQGVVQECCYYKGCTLSELSSYCGRR